MVRDAVLAGAGVALLPKLLVADDIASQRLVLWGIHDAPGVAIWALQSSRRLMSAKVRAFLKVLGETYPNKVFVPARDKSLGRPTSNHPPYAYASSRRNPAIKMSINRRALGSHPGPLLTFANPASA